MRMYLRILQPTPWLSVIECLNLKAIKDEHIILDGTGDRDGAHRGGGNSIGEDKGKRFIYNCSIRRQC